MRVTIRVDTSVSLSDFGSSVYGGSDDERIVSSSSSVGRRSARSGRSRVRGMNSRASSSSFSSVAYDTPPTSRNPPSLSPTRSHTSSFHGPSPLSRSWSEALCQKWVKKKKFDSNGVGGASTGESNYGDALTNLGDLSLTRSEDWSESEAESEESAHTRGPESRVILKRRSDATLQEGSVVHKSTRCKSCLMSPIVGIRYHCASCNNGADFVSTMKAKNYRRNSKSH
jgi:hypothetical protein